MKIELLYFDGCPNHSQALENLKVSLRQLNLDADVTLIRVQDNDQAVKHRFLGSPSVRIDGRDLEGADVADAQYSMRCRRYKHGSETLGYPPRELILEALKSALSGKGAE